MIHDFASWLVYSKLGLSASNHWGQSLHFFVYDSIKILFLLLVMTFVMGIVNSYFPVERVRKFLTQRKWFGFDHLLASVFGAITPFCSCSSIPLFMGFLKGGIPLGVTLSFLITSPLVNEVALAMFIGLFGVKVTVIYAVSGILIGTIVGWILGKLKLEKYVEDWVWQSIQSGELQELETSSQSFFQRLPSIAKEALSITKSVVIYVLIGIGIGAAIHGFLPTGYFEAYITKSNPLAVPLAVLLGIPLYANATGVIPVLQALVAKGIPLGTALAFSMAVVGLSIPEGALLKKVMKMKLVAIYFGSVGLSIIFLGYLFNFIF